MSHIGERIKQARIDKGMTQADLASALGKTKATISRYELSSREPRYAQLCAIADALNIPVQQLAGPFPEEEKDIADNQQESLKSKKQERFLMDLFSELSDKGQTEAVRRLSELAQLPIYRRELTLPQTLSQYASCKYNVDYHVVEDTFEKENISPSDSFGNPDAGQTVRHIVINPIPSGREKKHHFWIYPDPVADRETMDRILTLHIPDDYIARHALVFCDLESYNQACNCMDSRFFDDEPDSDGFPDLYLLLAERNETGNWTIQS